MTRNPEALALAEAIRFYQKPYPALQRTYGEETMRAAFAAPAVSDIAWEAAAGLKPQYYGRIGKLIEFTMEKTFSGPMTDGVPRLYRLDTGMKRREATTQDRNTLDGLQECWTHTLFRNLLDVAGPQVTDLNVKIAQRLHALRMHAIGNDRLTFDGQLGGAVHNAATQTIRLAISMNRYPNLGIYNKMRVASRHAALVKSSGPLRSVVNLDIRHLEQFAADFLGETLNGPNGMYKIRPRQIKSNMYHSLANGNADFMTPIEEMRSPLYGLIGNIPIEMPGEPLGCPIRMTGYTPALWIGVTNSMAQEGVFEQLRHH